jgi:hypothetical protein
MNSLSASLFAVAVLFTAAACSKQQDSSATTTAHHHHHEHTAPHGGTAVALGDEAYHLEFVRDPAAGTLTAYVLDGHMEEFIRIDAASFNVAASVNGASHLLTFRAVANSATGETVGNTSQFEAQADWLKSTSVFDAVLENLTIRGTTFTGVSFNFPAGNDPH